MAEPDPPTTASLAAVGPWLYEPDRAVTQAGLLGAVTAATLGSEVDRGLGYVVSEAQVDVPFARRYAVREVMPFSERSLRAWLREQGITGLTIKKRGVRLDDDELRRQLRIGRKAGGGAQATVILTRVAGEQAVLVVDPA
jgi:THUMP domain-like